MSPVIHCCVLCGHDIRDGGSDDSGWMLQFRILYSIDEQVQVTGVGFHNDPGAIHLEAPLDYGARWDTSESRVEIGVIRQSPVNGRHGFPFHEACWSLLEQAYSPRPIPQRRLLDACRSLPFSIEMCCVTWGHDFGGLISADEESYPWEDLFVNQELDFVTSNPFVVPEIQRLPHEAPESLDVPESEAICVVTRRSDVFTKLPAEIISCISHHLPTVDYLNARLAASSFYPIFNAQSFWASRFLPNADRSWVFEAQTWEMPRSWLWIYRRTANGSPGMKNRRRIWQLVETVKQILRLEWFEPASSSITNVIKTDWPQAAGDLRPGFQQPDHGFRGGCRQLREKQVHIPRDQLSHLAFSLIQIGNDTYITGIGFLLSRGETIRLGYMADDERVLNAKCLTGFNLAVGSRGVQAIQCILNGDQESQWIGSPDNAPKTQRLKFAGPITDIKAGFDGYKMVSLAANGCIRPGQKSLRDSAFWYPQIPDASLYLNEGGFTARDTAISRFDPVCWTRFGGPAGKYLRLLTGISVFDLGAIEFHYNSEDVPLECRKIGRYRPSEFDKPIHFKIDGPSGEKIDSLTIYMCSYPNATLWYYNPGVLQSFKISTNYGNSCHFPSMPEKTVQRNGPLEIERAITLVDGSTLTGLYWTQHENTIISLGAISEVV